MRLCHAARVPGDPIRRRHLAEGHVAALYGGACLDLSQMTQVLEINAADLDRRVQAGVTHEQLDARTGRGRACSFPSIPAPTRTLGGMAAARALRGPTP
ncbi:MAG: FAD-binding protein [Betaproteobacteria bacterium]|nr:FAD-binding protein [Betaproteobacteria bacterium]